jgi:hypothetical protein
MPIDMKALARLGAQVRIAALVAEIDALLGAFPDLGKSPARAASTPAEARSGRRRKGNKMSEATRAKLRASWAKRKAASVKPGDAEQTVADAQPATAQVVVKKRTMSAEARARISAAQKRRWATRKKGTKKKE